MHVKHDANGNRTSDGQNTYAYDARDRLLYLSGTGHGSYSYNAFGQRVRKKTDASRTFAYNEAGQLLGEYDFINGVGTQEFIWLNDLPVAVVQNDSIYYIHPDHLGTPRVITDHLGRTIWRWDSEPFGSTAANDDPDGDGQNFTFNLRFPGQYFDAEMGLHYNYFRTYDPAVGGYTTSDPIGLLGGLNTYSYVYNSPLIWGDPEGLIGGGLKKTINALCVVIGLCNAGAHVAQGKAGPPSKIPGPTREQAARLNETKPLEKLRKDNGSKPKSFCPIDPIDLSAATSRESCLNGDVDSCSTYEFITGESVMQSLSSEECYAMGLCI